MSIRQPLLLLRFLICFGLLALCLTIASALGPYGTVRAWGFDISSSANNQTHVVAVAAGDDHSLALKSDGSVEAFGLNSWGQITVPAGLSSGVVAIAAGQVHSMALKSNGTVACWGYDADGETDVPAGLSGVVAIAAGDFHSMALKADGTLVCWGQNILHQCDVPGAYQGHLVAIAGGTYHSAAIDTDGRIVCWGNNDWNQCDAPNATFRVFTAIAVGANHSLALTSTGQVMCWGDNSHGECNTPAGLSDVVAISAGSRHSVALKADGTVVCWGDNDASQCNVPSDLHNVFALGSGGPSRETVAIYSVPTIGTLTLTAVSVQGNGLYGAPLRGNLVLNAPASASTTFNLSSSDPCATLPATLTVGKGKSSATFIIGTNYVSAAKNVTISASLSGYESATANLQVTPITITNFPSPASPWEGGIAFPMTVSVSKPVVNPLTIVLDADNSAATPPSTVQIPAGQASATFSVATTTVLANQTVHISATLGASHPVVTLKIAPAPIIQSISIPPIYGHQKVTGQVSLRTAALKNGTTVLLSTDVAGLTLPATVFIPAGSKTAAFEVSSDDVASQTSVVVSASNSMGTVTKSVNIVALLPTAITLSPTLVVGGTSSSATVKLNAKVAFDTVVTFSVVGKNASVTSSVIVPADSDSVTTTVTTLPVTTTKTAAIKVAKNSGLRSTTLTITP